ncbi:unnamed protein product [Urochloa humidicola]
MDIRFVIVVLSLVIHAGAEGVASEAGRRRRLKGGEEWYKPGTSVSFYVESRPYPSVGDEIKGWIYAQRDQYTDELEDYPDNPVLKNQFLSRKPANWLLPLLLGRGTARTNLAFRSDNLYLSAFTNGLGERFSFKTEHGEYVIPGSTVLNFKNNYRDLVAGGVGTEEQAWQYLIGLEIGRDAVLTAIDTANEYNPQTTPDAVIQRALATLIVVFMEAQRFPYIRQQVVDAWNNGGRLNALGAQMVVNWRRISCALRIWDWEMKEGRGNVWDSEEAEEIKVLNINTPKDARDAIGPVLHSGKCSK